MAEITYGELMSYINSVSGCAPLQIPICIEQRKNVDGWTHLWKTYHVFAIQSLSIEKKIWKRFMVE